MIPRSRLQAMKPKRRKVVQSSSMPAPVGGLNVVDPINLMPKADALSLVNWIAQQYGVRSRKGYREYAINFDRPVQTIMQYSPDRATLVDYRMFAVTDGDIFDISAATDTPVSVVTLTGGANYGRFSWTTFTNAADVWLICASNQGGYRYYDGATWALPTMGVGPGQISGVDPSNLNFVTSWKGRVWAIERGTNKAWYGAPGAITGVFSMFDFGPLMENGGVLSFIARWTIDAGTGIDDYLVIGGENGDILIYKGTDPSDIATFAMVGNWYVGRIPLGQRAYCQLGGDLLILSTMGIQPLSYVTRGGQSMFRVSSIDYLRKVQPLFSEAVAAKVDQLGWEMCLNMEEDLLIVQQPTNTSINEQYALYTNNNTWSIFSGMPMITMFSGANGFFFASPDNKVYQGFTGYFDNVEYGETVGTGITGKIQPSYSYFGLPGRNKQWSMARPTFIAADRPYVNVTMLADYDQGYIPQSPAYFVGNGALWDTAVWDSSVWAGGLQTYADWVAVAAIGYAGSIILDTVVLGDTFLASIDYQFELGGEI